MFCRVSFSSLLCYNITNFYVISRTAGGVQGVITLQVTRSEPQQASRVSFRTYVRNLESFVIPNRRRCVRNLEKTIKRFLVALLLEMTQMLESRHPKGYDKDSV
jgi:hypothetical protein